MGPEWVTSTLSRRSSTLCSIQNGLPTRIYCTAHGTLLSVCAGLEGKGVWGRMDTRVCRAESLRWSPEAAITLLPGFTPIQNKKLKLGEKKKRVPQVILMCFWKKKNLNRVDDIE